MAKTRLDAYEVFCLYIAIKNHFTKPSYDFFKYNGKTNINKESFLARRDKYQFHKLSRMYKPDEMRDFLVANFVKEDMWVGTLLQDEAADNFSIHKGTMQSLSYYFGNEIEKAFSTVAKPDDIFAVEKGGEPHIVNLYLQGEVSIYTLILLDEFVGFMKKFDKKLGDDYIWSKLSFRLKKLRPFIEFDKEKIKSILKEKVDVYK
jgi:hypothetical protein